MVGRGIGEYYREVPIEPGIMVETLSDTSVQEVEKVKLENIAKLFYSY